MVLVNFKRQFPFIADDVAKYVDIGDTYVDVILIDGTRIIYDDLDNTIRHLPTNSSHITEEECKKEFGIRLRRLMHLKGVTETELSKKTDISPTRLSGYITGKNSPSFYKVDKIAKALGCSLDELRYV